MIFNYMMIPGLSYDARNKQDDYTGIKRYMNVIEAVCESTGVSYEMMQSEYRGRQNVEARALAFHCIKHFYPDISFTRIGNLFNRNHATVLHGLQKVKDWSETDPEFRKKFEKVFREAYLKA